MSNTIRDISEGQVVETTPEQPLPTPPSVNSSPLPELEMRAVEQVMGLETDSERNTYKTKTQTLLDWAKTQTTDHSPENLKWVIRSLELKLGTPPLAEKRINYVARYAYLLTEESKIQKERKAFEQRTI